ncbi:MAG: hypothetical protein LBE32_01295 [Burkholderiales bacterium]|jgi:hypothetical protein|nr:hypothetical protein [Burkholderiales bacterium]
MLQIHGGQYNHAFRKKASRFVFWEKNLGGSARKATSALPFCRFQKTQNPRNGRKAFYLFVFEG